MDALIYTAMSGAERALHAQQVRANNLANADTPGFRADLEISVSEAVQGYGYDARYMGRLQADTLSTRQGPMQQTDRDLDVAIAGDGFLAVQWGEGEAYTRSGALTVDPEGTLTVNGRPVMGEGGPIVLPPYSQLAIGEDGTTLDQLGSAIEAADAGGRAAEAGATGLGGHREERSRTDRQPHPG